MKVKETFLGEITKEEIEQRLSLFLAEEVKPSDKSWC